jgi:hypothetical protein
LQLEKDYKELNERFNTVSQQKSFNQEVTLTSTEENINDLLLLANQELEAKSKTIYDLSSRLAEYEISNIKTLKEEELNKLKAFYSTKLTQVIEALNHK